MISVAPHKESDSSICYQFPFDLKVEAVAKTLLIARHTATNYRFERFFDFDDVDEAECCVCFSVDVLEFPEDREVLLVGNELKRKGALTIKGHGWSSKDINCSVQISGFNSNFRSNLHRKKLEFYFNLGNIAKNTGDTITITLEFSRAPTEASLRNDMDVLYRNDMKALLTSGDNSDVTVECDGRPFPCHKAILAARSETFAAMFRSGFKENAESKVVVQEMEAKVMQLLLTFIYTGRLPTTAISVDLLKAADMYMVSGLKRMCCEVLGKGVTVANCCLMLETGNQYDDVLFERAMEVVVSHKRTISKTDEWRNMAESGQLWRRISENLLEKL